MNSYTWYLEQVCQDLTKTKELKNGSHVMLLYVKGSDQIKSWAIVDSNNNIQKEYNDLEDLINDKF